MPDPSAAADSGLLSSIYSQIAAGTAGSLFLWRILVSFGRQDRASKMEAEIREDLRKQVADLRGQVEQLQDDIAKMAHERNEAVMIRKQLETELRLNNERLGTTRAERDDARTALVRVQADVERLTATNHQLVEDAALAESRGGQGAQPCAPAPTHRPTNPTEPRAVPGERLWQG